MCSILNKASSNSLVFFFPKPVTHLSIPCMGSHYKYHLLKVIRLICFHDILDVFCIVYKSSIKDAGSHKCSWYRRMKDLRPCGAGEGPECNIGMVPKARVKADIQHYNM